MLSTRTRRVALLATFALVGCHFDPAGLGGGTGSIDAAGGHPDGPFGSPDAPVGSPDAAHGAIDARPPPPSDAQCMFAIVDLCKQGAPDAPLAITGQDTIDTDTDPRCRTLGQADGGPDACLVYANGITIAAGASLTATGQRPLVLAAPIDIQIDGLLDVSSRNGGNTGAGADFADCPAFAATPENDIGGAAGGAGGSFLGVGGNGGTGDTDNSLGLDGTANPGLAAPAQAAPTFVRGGCAGQDGGNESGLGGSGGVSGSSGGAVYVLSSTHVGVGSGGAIRATGAGGDGGAVQSGGGGGGSGGYVGIEAPTVTVAGKLSANGGGGGGGGARVGLSSVSGGTGSDGDLTSQPAMGGTPSHDNTGGTGSAGTTAAMAGTSSIVGGGGGGGGAGLVRVRGTLSLTGTSSPAPTP